HVWKASVKASKTASIYNVSSTTSKDILQCSIPMHRSICYWKLPAAERTSLQTLKKQKHQWVAKTSPITWKRYQAPSSISARKMKHSVQTIRTIIRNSISTKKE